MGSAWCSSQGSFDGDFVAGQLTLFTNVVRTGLWADASVTGGGRIDISIHSHPLLKAFHTIVRAERGCFDLLLSPETRNS